ncbi:MAG: hypothetical protein LBL92_03455 [Propionibacteriaceae bacterium]|nr:hypothetical protein [Propionibacteriaceae bacterium]
MPTRTHRPAVVKLTGLISLLLVISVLIVANPSDAAAERVVSFSVSVDVPGTTTNVQSGQAESSGCVAADGTSIPCTDRFGGAWNGNCYLSQLADDISAAITRLKYSSNQAKQTEGSFYRCVDSNGYATLLWQPNAQLPPSPQELADSARLLISGNITAADIGIYPDGLKETGTENFGIVGFPTWYWTKNPSPVYTSPQTHTTSLRGHSLRVTAKFNYSLWDTGDDGTTLTCGLGTEAVNVDSPQRSPSGCDHIYRHKGDYTITATWYFTIEWTGAGQRGTFTLQVDQTGTYHVGEVHIVNVPNP